MVTRVTVAGCHMGEIGLSRGVADALPGATCVICRVWVHFAQLRLAIAHGIACLQESPGPEAGSLPSKGRCHK